jgi:carboxylate-amine ligase
VLVVTLSVASPLCAQELGPTLLSYSAPEGCPNVADFRSSVRRRSTRVRFVEEGAHDRELSIAMRKEGEHTIGELRLTERDGSPTELGRLLIDPLLAGTLGCANSPGSGIADDKAIHTYVEAMISFYLDEDPILSSVPGWDLGDPAQREEALPRLEELVIKPRSEFGGAGVLVGPLATAEELRHARAVVEAAPERYVAQVPVPLSVHPTIIDGEVRGRHVDLRPFVFTGSAATSVMSGGLTRYAREEDEMIVNSGRGGGAKDTWVLQASAEATAS